MGSLNIELRLTTCSSLLLWASVLLLLLLSQRLRPMPRLILLSFTEPTDMPVCHTPVMPDTPMELTHMPMVLTTERDLLMLRLRLMLTMVSMDTHMLLDMPDMPMELTHMPMVLTTERDLLMLSQRLTPTTMDMPDLMPMDMPHMLMVLMDVSGDKLNATQLRSSKANIKYQWRSVPKK